MIIECIVVESIPGSIAHEATQEAHAHEKQMVAKQYVAAAHCQIEIEGDVSWLTLPCGLDANPLEIRALPVSKETATIRRSALRRQYPCRQYLFPVSWAPVQSSKNDVN